MRVGQPRTCSMAAASLLWLLLALVCAADTVRLLPDDAAAWEAREEMFAVAQVRLDAAYFIVRNDRTSQAFLERLEQTARRGVRVRLVADGMFQELAPTRLARLLAAGVEVREFHRPEFPYLTTYTRRLHDKYLSLDGRMLLAGSRNIDDGHFGIEQDGRNYVDVDILIEGAAAQAGDRYFESLWCGPHVAPLQPRHQPSPQRGERPAVNAQRDSCDTTAGDGWTSAGRFPTVAVPACAVHFAHDPAGAKYPDHGTHVALDRLFDSAQATIDIESPYLLPVGEFGATLCRAIRRGVRVRILTNSSQTTDHVSIHAAFVESIEPFRRQGMEVWEYRGPRILHAKTCVVDERVAVVSSFNFDPRSRALDTQLAVLIQDREVAGQLSQIMAFHRRDATPLQSPRARIARGSGALRDELELRTRAAVTRPLWGHF